MVKLACEEFVDDGICKETMLKTEWEFTVIEELVKGFYSHPILSGLYDVFDYG